MRRATLFGKLPAHGDFVTRGLAAAERDSLDDWLAGSLADAREWLGDTFENVYDQAPPWRFVRRTDEGWRAGAIAPSMDGVGRRYPVVAGLEGVDGGEAAGVAEAVEALLYAALGEGWSADRLVEALAASGPAAMATEAASGDRWWTLGGGTGTGWAFFEDELTEARPPRLMRSVLTLREIGRETGREEMA